MKKLVAFFEIPANNFERAVKFYEQIFSIQMTTCESEKEKMAFFPEEEGRAPGAISKTDKFNPSQYGVLISLNCEDITSTLSLVLKEGGKIITSKTKIEAEHLGYFAVFSDCEGNHIGLYSDN